MDRLWNPRKGVDLACILPVVCTAREYSDTAHRLRVFELGVELLKGQREKDVLNDEGNCSMSRITDEGAAILQIFPESCHFLA